MHFAELCLPGRRNVYSDEIVFLAVKNFYLKKSVDCKWPKLPMIIFTTAQFSLLTTAQLTFLMFHEVHGLVCDMWGSGTVEQALGNGEFYFRSYFWWRQLAAGRSLNCASCRGDWGERSFPRSTTAIHSVAVDRTPNLPIERLTLCTELSLSPMKR